MDKFKQLAKIREIYAKGDNIIKYLKSLDQIQQNTIEDILISYDFQSGSYIKSYAKNLGFRGKYCTSLARVIDNLGRFDSIMEVGVGEATTLGNLMGKMKSVPQKVMGFDISWSRLKFARNFLSDLGREDVSLFTANLFEIPLEDSSVDVVYTSHSIEPNGGREEDALRELFRITGKYLVLLEPSYELADEESRRRMEEYGYITKLHSTAQKLGFKIVEHRLFDHSAKPLNPTGLIIIEKSSSSTNQPDLRCPITRTDLIKHSDGLMYSKDSFLAYPVVEGIPCLLKENSILATHLLTDYQEFKNENGISF